MDQLKPGRCPTQNMRFNFRKLAEGLKQSALKTQKALRQEIVASRRCVAIKPNGERCKGWAVMVSSEQLCAPHLYRTRRPDHEMTNEVREQQAKRNRPTCQCPAYSFPHRPSNGFCRYPDPPTRKHALYPGHQRALGKLRRRKIKRILKKMGL